MAGYNVADFVIAVITLMFALWDVTAHQMVCFAFK